MDKPKEELLRDIEIAETMKLGIGEPFWGTLVKALLVMAQTYEAQVSKSRSAITDLNKANFYKGIAIGLTLALEMPEALIKRGEEATKASRDAIVE